MDLITEEILSKYKEDLMLELKKQVKSEILKALSGESFVLDNAIQKLIDASIQRQHQKSLKTFQNDIINELSISKEQFFRDIVQGIFSVYKKM